MKKLSEQITIILANNHGNFVSPITNILQIEPEWRNSWLTEADNILALIKEAGYRKVPELEIIKGIEAEKILMELTPCHSWSSKEWGNLLHSFKLGNRAQLDSIEKQIEDANILKGKE